jgi:predicted DNA-binding helix-hairpin-helix protein
LKRAMPFIICADYHPTQAEAESLQLRRSMAAPAAQLSLAL